MAVFSESAPAPDFLNKIRRAGLGRACLGMSRHGPFASEKATNPLVFNELKDRGGAPRFHPFVIACKAGDFPQSQAQRLALYAAGAPNQAGGKQQLPHRP